MANVLKPMVKPKDELNNSYQQVDPSLNVVQPNVAPNVEPMPQIQSPEANVSMQYVQPNILTHNQPIQQPAPNPIPQAEPINPSAGPMNQPAQPVAPVQTNTINQNQAQINPVQPVAQQPAPVKKPPFKLGDFFKRTGFKK